MAETPKLGTKENPIKVKVKKGGSAADLAAAVAAQHQTIAGLNAEGDTFMMVPGKNIGGSGT